MDNQHRHIKGYRELTEEEIDLMNETKELAESCNKLLNKLTLAEGTDMRCLRLARDNLQQGFMWAVRAVAKPDSF